MNAPASWRVAPGTTTAGIKLPGNGYDSGRFRVPTMRTSTKTAATAYPFLSPTGLLNRGTYIGRNRANASPFCYDPWELYAARLIDNPNALIVADIGSGKTNLACALTLRSLPFGRKIAAVDIKDDLARIAEIYGGQAISVGAPGSTQIINPLDVDLQTEDVGVVLDKRASTLRAVLAIKLGRELQAARFEESALIAAIEQATAATNNDPILSDVYAALCEPTRPLWDEVYVDRDTYMHSTSELRGAYHSLLQGRAGALFNGRSTVRFSSDAPIVVTNLKPLSEDSHLLPIAFTLASAWLEGALMRGDAPRWALYDEAWKVLQTAPAAVSRLQQQFRLARAYGIANLLVLHNISDAAAIAVDGSAASKQAQQLVSMAATRMVGKVVADQLQPTQDALALTDTERSIVSRAGTGEFVFKIQTTAGVRGFWVQVARHALEAQWWDTTGGMALGAANHG